MISGWIKPGPWRLAAALLLSAWIGPGTLAQTLGAPAAVEAAAAREIRLVPLEISVNGAPVGNWVLLDLRGVLHAPAEALQEWRLKIDASSFEFRGQLWAALSAIPGFQALFNFANQSVELRFAPEAFAATRLVRDIEPRPELSAAIPAFFANYDVSYSHSALRGAGGSREFGLLTELGYTSSLGVLTSSQVAQQSFGTGAARSSWRRLETTFTRDFVDSNTTLRLGDSSTRVGSWGRSVYFGGIQLARNFDLNPGFITQPIPSLTGTSSAPSTVELYINDALRKTSNVPAGPFAIDNFPLVTGSGEARVVVRDILGRETVLSQSFFTHSSLLEQDLEDWSLEAGAVRRNLGVASGDYGERFVAGSYRRGLSKSMTLEGRAEWGGNTQLLGAGLLFELPGQALGQAAFSRSRSDLAGSGFGWLLGIERSGLRHGYTLRAERNSRSHRELANPDLPPIRQQLSGSYSYASEALGVFGLGAAVVDSFAVGRLSTVSANHSIRVGQRGALTFSATRVSGAGRGSAVGLSLVLPLENLGTLSGSVNHRPANTDAYVSVSRPLSEETGAGWRALTGTRSGQAYAEGGLYYQGFKGSVSADLSASAAQQTLRLGGQGGLILVDGRFYANRSVHNSFALVEVPGYANVSIGVNGRKLTRTDRDGVALLAHLQPYQANRIQLDPAELPISAEIDNIEQITVPGYRSAVRVVYPVRSGRAALLRILLDDGEAAPAGSVVQIQGDPQEFYVARRGEVFVTGLQPQNRLRLKWNDAICDLSVRLPEGQIDEIARIGPISCAGVRR